MSTIKSARTVDRTPEATERLRDGFERSALEWLERASVAEINGRQGAATAAMAVAGIAARVACGGAR